MARIQVHPLVFPFEQSSSAFIVLVNEKLLLEKKKNNNILRADLQCSFYLLECNIHFPISSVYINK